MYDIMPQGKGKIEHKQITKGISMKTPATEENLFPYTDRPASIRILNGSGSRVGIGNLSLDKENQGGIKIHFERCVEIKSRQKLDEQADEGRLEPIPVSGTFATGRTEQFRSVEVVRATAHELQLHSKEAEIRLYFSPSIPGNLIESIVSRCK